MFGKGLGPLLPEHDSILYFSALPKSLQCPGGNNSWHEIKETETTVVCKDELNLCDRGKHEKKIFIAHAVSCSLFYSIPNDKILDLSKLKEFTDNKINVIKICFGKGRKHCGERGKCKL